ncbi:TfoX/Sxy family DNA transformation protein [Pseudooceanicola sp. HF7]|uniref:TfoX/Sxy family DNA transformation protein n=1 Tax=Pseudooceanicola sp. HF7 TaxID=2721560 RepID=UPI0014314157|nr:TfoX/Sxy family DNA transformation protein [Pseudooceanicola sp. HF7]NIZ11693.1 TfoX/Sxy family protein [Pseudooceanicola sp. HF7]
MSALTKIRNLGPKTAQALQRAGIHSAEELREIGVDAAYTRAVAAGMPAHFVGYYALVMGLQGRPWNDLTPAEKIALRPRFDALCAQARNAPCPEGALPGDLDAFLDRIGLPAR